MPNKGYHRQRLQLDDGAWAAAHRVDIPADALSFEDLHPISSYIRQQDIARMRYARARARGEEAPQILTWTAMQTDRRASEMFPDLTYKTDDGENIISANSFITCVLRQLLANGWLELHEYVGDTYEWKVTIPEANKTWGDRADAILRYLEESIQLDLYPNVERGTYQPRVFRPFDLRHNFARIGRCDFIRHFVQNHERRVIFNTSHFLHEHDDLVSHHSGYGDAIGLMVAEGTVLRPPIYRRGALLFDGESWRIDTVGLDDIALTLPGEITLAAGDNGDLRFVLNPAEPQPIALYTRAANLSAAGAPLDRSPASADRIEFVVVNRQALAWKRGGDMQIPQNGFLLSIQAGALPDETIESIIADAWVEYAPADAALRIHAGIQAGPMLLRNGDKVLAEAAAREEFWPSQAGQVGISPVRMRMAPGDRRKARTAIGIKENGDLLLVVVDGCEPACRSELDSAGATLSELTDLLQRAGAVDALNLSGEGSSHLFVAGGLANTPSDRRGLQGVVFERMLPSIGIVP